MAELPAGVVEMIAGQLPMMAAKVRDQERDFVVAGMPLVAALRQRLVPLVAAMGAALALLAPWPPR